MPAEFLMGNPPRGGVIEKLVESLQGHGGGAHDIFHAVHRGGPGVVVTPSMGPPPQAGPPPPPHSLSISHSHSHPHSHSNPHPSLESFPGGPEPGNFLDLLVHPPHHHPSVRSSSHPDILASLGENVLGSSDGSQGGELQFFDPAPPSKKSSWSSNTIGQSKQLPSSSLWVLSRPPLNKASVQLPGLAAGSGGSNNPAPIANDDRICQSSRQQSSIWGGRGGDRAQGGIEKSMPGKLEKPLAKSIAGAATGVAGCGLGGESLSPARPTKDLVGDVDMKIDSSDCSDHNMDEQEDENGNNGQTGTGRIVSKNLISERKRRKKLNEGLYTLRSLVPRISKMDKASIIGDAIDYVRELQKQVEDLQTGISNMEASAASGEEVLSTAAVAEQSSVVAQTCENRLWEEDGKKCLGEKAAEENVECVEQQILELDVSLMEDQIYHLQIFCTKGPGVFVQLMQSLEALGLEVLNANLTSLQDNIVNTFIAEIKDWEMMKTEDVKKAIMDVASRFGLQ